MKKEIVVGIYKITSPSGKINIGQSWNIDKRWDYYKRLECKGQIKLYNSLKLYGYDNHVLEKWEILPNDTTQEILDEREIYWIKFYKNQGCEMMNLREGGSHGKHSPETIEILRERSRNNKYHLGHFHSEGTKQQIRDRRALQVFTLEHLENLSKSRKGKKKPQSFIEFARENMKGNKYGKVTAKKIIQFDLQGIFIKEWHSMTEAAKVLKISLSNLCGACNHKRQGKRNKSNQYHKSLWELNNNLNNN